MTARGDQTRWDTTSPEVTFAFGETLGRSLIGGITVGLVGPLGAGKTLLVKGIAAGNAVEDVRQVTSPTFTLVNEYPGRLCLYHLDAYRLSSAAEFLALGFDELVHPDSAVVVEWAERVREVMPEETLWIEFDVTGQTSRTLSLRAAGDPAETCLEALRAAKR